MRGGVPLACDDPAYAAARDDFAVTARRVRAIADDPKRAESWYVYARAVLGVRDSDFRSTAESSLGTTVHACLPIPSTAWRAFETACASR